VSLRALVAIRSQECDILFGRDTFLHVLCTAAAGLQERSAGPVPRHAAGMVRGNWWGIPGDTASIEGSRSASMSGAEWFVQRESCIKFNTLSVLWDSNCGPRQGMVDAGGYIWWLKEGLVFLSFFPLGKKRNSISLSFVSLRHVNLVI